MVERNSVVMEDCEVEDAVIHFFIVQGQALMGHWWKVKYPLKPFLQKKIHKFTFF